MEDARNPGIFYGMTYVSGDSESDEGYLAPAVYVADEPGFDPYADVPEYFALLSATSLTLVGQPPEEVPPGYSSIDNTLTVDGHGNVNGPIESAIYSIDAADQVSIQWINPDGTKPALLTALFNYAGFVTEIADYKGGPYLLSLAGGRIGSYQTVAAYTTTNVTFVDM